MGEVGAGVGDGGRGVDVGLDGGARGRGRRHDGRWWAQAAGEEGAQRGRGRRWRALPLHTDAGPAAALPLHDNRCSWSMSATRS
jgi:hypothetical protein